MSLFEPMFYEKHNFEQAQFSQNYIFGLKKFFLQWVLELKLDMYGKAQIP